MPQHLVTHILFDGSLALEWEACPSPDNHDRQRLERLLLDVSKADRADQPGKWLLLLGLSEESVPLSPSLDFWRGLAASWIHQARTAPEVEDKRAALSIKLADVEASGFLQRMPAMVGIDRADMGFIQHVWRSVQGAFAAGMRDFKGSVADYFQKAAPRPRHVDRIHFHLVENRKDFRYISST